jgi:hypothetical protein
MPDTKTAERSLGRLLEGANERLEAARVARVKADRLAARAKEREKSAEAERDRLAKALALVRGDEPEREARPGRVVDETAIAMVLKFVREAPGAKASVAQVYRGLGWPKTKSQTTRRYMSILVARGLLAPTGEVYQHGSSPITRSPIYEATNVVEYRTKRGAA